LYRAVFAKTAAAVGGACVAVAKHCTDSLWPSICSVAGSRWSEGASEAAGATPLCPGLCPAYAAACSAKWLVCSTRAPSRGAGPTALRRFRSKIAQVSANRPFTAEFRAFEACPLAQGKFFKRETHSV